MLCAVAVFADPVVLPATLDVSNVSFRSDGMPDFVVDEGDYAGTYFDMGAHDSSNDTLLYAEWDVTIEPLLYNISVDVYNTNSWSVRLHILNQANEEVKSLYYKGHSGEKGQFAIGSLDLRDLEAGYYKVRAHCSYAWSALKLKDVIFDADYSGATVALPGELLPAYAELSANASISNGAIAFKPSTAPDEYANWNVSFAKAGSYNVKIDITASNGHNYGVELITEDEETIIGAVNEGGQVSDTGEKELGAIEVPAAGNYIVHLTNAIKWSEAVLNSITFAAPYEPAMKTIYCKMDKDWWKADGAAVGVYTWDDGGNAKAAWPGERMTPVEGETDVWSIELDINTYKNCIFTRVNGTGDIADWGAKTANQTIPTDDNDMFTITNDAAVWGDPGCDGVWSVYTPGGVTPQPVMTAVYGWADKIGTTILGTTGVEVSTVKIHTNTDEIPAIKFASSYVYDEGKWLAIKPAEGGFKAGDVVSISGVISNSDDTGAKYAQIDMYAADGATRLLRTENVVNGRVSANDPFVDVITLESDQDSLFFGRYGNTNLFITMLKIERAGGAPEPEFTYTVAGSSEAAFGTTWDPTNADNDMIKLEDGTYKWEKTGLTLAAGDVKFKVCQDHDWAVAYPAQDYVLNIPEAGIYTITITYNPEGNVVAADAVKTGDAVVIPTVAMHGNFTGEWKDTENFTLAEGNATASLKLTIAAGNYEFGMRIGGSGNWTANGAAFSRESNSAVIEAGQGNLTLAADVDGEYTFTWTYETNTLSIAFPTSTGISNTNADVKAVKLIENGQIVIIRNGEKFNVQGQVIR
jgi:hypothetical protein